MGSCSLDFWLGLASGESCQEFGGTKASEVKMFLPLLPTLRNALGWPSLLATGDLKAVFQHDPLLPRSRSKGILGDLSRSILELLEPAFYWCV